MQTIQLKIQNDTIADKILSILNVFKDDGVLVENITKDTLSKEEFEDDIKQAFKELKNKEGKATGKFVELEV